MQNLLHGRHSDAVHVVLDLLAVEDVQQRLI